MVDRYKPYEVSKGRQLEIRDTNTGEIFAGSWAVSQMEDADEMICIGTYEDEIRGPFEPAKLRVQNMLEKKNILTGVDVEGKKNLMVNTERQLIDSGHSVVHITENDCSPLINTVPEDRYDDIVYVDPFDSTEEIGFNILESPVDSSHSDFEDVTDAISESFVSMLRDASNTWSPMIESKLEALVDKLVRADDPFDMIDLIKILTDEDELKYFVENYRDIEPSPLEHILQQDQEKFDPIVRLVRNWFEQRASRGIGYNSDSDFDLFQLMEEGKTVVFDLSDYERVGVLKAMIASRIRVVGKALSDDSEPFVVFDGLSEDRYNSYVVDQIDKSSGFSFFISFERLGDYSKDTQRTLKDSEVKISFRCGNDESEASRIALLYSTSADRILNLGSNRCISHTMTEDGYVSDNAVDIRLFQLCPPVGDRSLQDIRERSYRRFGSASSQTDLDNYGPSRFAQ